MDFDAKAVCSLEEAWGPGGCFEGDPGGTGGLGASDVRCIVSLFLYVRHNTTFPVSDVGNLISVIAVGVGFFFSK